MLGEQLASALTPLPMLSMRAPSSNDKPCLLGGLHHDLVIVSRLRAQALLHKRWLCRTHVKQVDHDHGAKAPVRNECATATDRWIIVIGISRGRVKTDERDSATLRCPATPEDVPVVAAAREHSAARFAEIGGWGPWVLVLVHRTRAYPLLTALKCLDREVTGDQLVVQCRHFSSGDDAATVHDREPVADLAREGQLLFDDQHA